MSTGTTTDTTSRNQEHRKRDQALVALHKAGDTRAFGRLYDLWFDPVYDRIVNRGVRPRDAAAAATDAFAATARDVGRVSASESFAAVALRATRRATGKAGGGKPSPGPHAVGAEERLAAATSVTAIAADTEVAQLCRQSADVLGERVRESLDLHYRHGLSSREIAAVLRERPETVATLLPKLPLGFGNTVRARVLWRGGSPEHDALRRELVGHDRFDPETVRIVSRHLKECDQCRARALVALPPVEVFAAIPIASAPVGLKEQVASALAASGTPMTGSAYLRPADRAAATTPDDAHKPTISSPTTARQSRNRGKALLAPAAGAALGAAAATAPTSAAGAASVAPPTTPPAEPAAPSTPPPASAEASSAPASAPVSPPTTSSPPTTAPGSPAPAHEPVLSGERKAGADVVTPWWRRPAAIGAAAAAAAVIVLGLVLLTRGGDDRAEIATASRPETTTTTNADATSTSRPAVTSTTVPLPSTTQPASPTTTAPVTNPIPAPAPAPSGGGAPAPTTPSTLAPLDLQVLFRFAPSDIAPGGSATLEWDISASRPLRVVIRGPEGFYAETLTGSTRVCPGATGCDVPGSTVGAYSLEVYDADRLVAQRSILLIIRPV